MTHESKTLSSPAGRVHRINKHTSAQLQILLLSAQNNSSKRTIPAGQSAGSKFYNSPRRQRPRKTCLYAFENVSPPKKSLARRIRGSEAGSGKNNKTLHLLIPAAELHLRFVYFRSGEFFYSHTEPDPLL